MIKILNVDDLRENRYILEVILGKAGFEVHSAEDGIKALAKLESEPFDLIISDILMPQMDGFQLCREVKRRPELCGIPFIFYSATFTERKDKELARELGAARFIVKPAEPKVFLEAIQEVLHGGVEGQGPSQTWLSSEEGYLLAYDKRIINRMEKKILELEHQTHTQEAALLAKDREVAELKQVEGALRASEARYRLIADHIGDVVWLWQRDSHYFTYISPSVERLWGFTPEEAMAHPVVECLSPEAWQRLSLDFPARILALEGGDEKARYGVTQITQPRKDGSPVPTEVVTKLLTDERLRVTSVLGISRDISIRKGAETALRESEERFRAMIRMAPIPFALVDQDERITSVNDKFMATFGYTLTDIPTLKEWWESAYPDEGYRRRVIQSWGASVSQAVLEKRNVEPAEYEVTCRDGLVRTVEISGITIGDSFLASFIDVTDRRKAEQEIRRLKEQMGQEL